MSPPRHIPRLIKVSPLAILVLIGLLVAGPATAAAPPGEVKATLSGPRQVVVRNLPPRGCHRHGAGPRGAGPTAIPTRVDAGPALAYPSSERSGRRLLSGVGAEHTPHDIHRRLRGPG